MLNTRVRSINSPYATIAEQVQKSKNFAKDIEQINLEGYNLEKMDPKVTYDDWVLCWCRDKKCFVVLNLVDHVCERVYVVQAYKARDEMSYVDDEGHIVDVDDILGGVDSDYCGDADDLSCYVYVSRKN